MDPRKAADLFEPLDYTMTFLQRSSLDLVESRSKWQRLFKASVIFVCACAVIESPLEVGGSNDLKVLLALVASKVLTGLIGTLAIANWPFGRGVFAFLCGASVLAIAPALPLEYSRCVTIALFSTVECIGKAVCVASFAIASLHAACGAGLVPEVVGGQHRDDGQHGESAGADPAGQRESCGWRWPRPI